MSNTYKENDYHTQVYNMDNLIVGEIYLLREYGKNNLMKFIGYDNDKDSIFQMEDGYDVEDTQQGEYTGHPFMEDSLPNGNNKTTFLNKYRDYILYSKDSIKGISPYAIGSKSDSNNNLNNNSNKTMSTYNKLETEEFFNKKSNIKDIKDMNNILSNSISIIKNAKTNMESIQDKAQALKNSFNRALGDDNIKEVSRLIKENKDVLQGLGVYINNSIIKLGEENIRLPEEVANDFFNK